MWSDNGRQSTIVQVKDVIKRFPVGDGEVTVLKGISLDIMPGEFVAMVGPSGNGKSTLLNMITGIDHPSEGQVIVTGQSVHTMTENELAVWRGEHLGIIFQFFQLLPALSLVKNVMLPMDLVKKLPKRERQERAMALLDMVGLADQAHKLPSQVSGGQQQRAAIARALANDPPLIVADEPTGNLDSTTAEDVFQFFKGLDRQGQDDGHGHPQPRSGRARLAGRGNSRRPHHQRCPRPCIPALATATGRSGQWSVVQWPVGQWVSRPLDQLYQFTTNSSWAFCGIKSGSTSGIARRALCWPCSASPWACSPSARCSA
jgi:putative ABC transport system ATP-binding protein